MSAFSWINQETIDGWHVMSGLGADQWVAWAKQSPMIARSPAHEPGDVYFEFGAAREEAISKLMASLPR